MNDEGKPIPPNRQPGQSQPGAELSARVEDAAQAETAPPQERRRRIRFFEGCLFAALLAFLGLAILASTAAYFEIDLAITTALQAFEAPWFEALMILVSWFGRGLQGPLLTAVLVGLVYFAGYRWEAAMSLFAALGSNLLTILIKLAIGRPRPDEDLVAVFRMLSDFSFPSGHVTVYTSFGGFLFFLSYSLLRPSWLRALLLVPFGGLVALVGPSRVYLGEHWASDVLGGYLLGGAFLLITIEMYRRGRIKREEAR